jgi:tetratricopeptide (TPR) repeat protein
MLTRLDDSLRFLTGAVRDLPARQQTLRRTLDWSYDLLSEPERTLFARLSVFAGGWTLEAAEQVCACDGVEVLETLQSLVDRSLINVQHAGAPSKQRFSMLATIREYARERLEATPAAGSVLAAHARYMLDLAEGAAARLRGAEQDAWRQRLSLEQDNVRAALRWLLDSGELDMASRLEMALTVFWWVQGYGSEARRWSDELLSREATLQPAARARAHLGSGLAAAWEGDYGRAVSLLEQAVAEFRPLGDARGAGVAQMALAYVSPLLDDYQRRESLLLESAADLFQAGDLWAVNVALQSRAEVALAAGDAARARELYQDSLELAQGQVDTRGRAQALLGLGFVELSRGDATAAAALLRQCVPFSLELGNLELLARALRGLASVADSQRQFDRAAHLLGAAHALSEAAGIVDWPIRRGLYAGTEQHVRDQLGRARFAATWAAGQRLTMTEAAAYALRMGGVKASAASQSRATAAVQDWSSEPSGSAVNGSKYLVQFCGGHNRTLWADDARGADHRVQGRTAVRAGRFSARSH